MRKKFIFAATASLSFLSAFIFADNEKTISKTDVKEVIVYLNGAFVLRTGSAMVGPGVSTIVFEGLSSTINPQTVNVRGKGDFLIMSVNHRMDYLNEEKKSPEIKMFEDSLEELQYRMGQLQNRKTVLTEQQNMLLANKSIGGANTGVSRLELEKVADYFFQRLTKIKNDLLDESKKEKKLQEQIQKVQNQLAVLNAKQNEPTSSIAVVVSAKARINAQFDLSYQVQNATWTPFYDIRSKDSGSPVQLALKANVSQSSGENWNDVKIKLSTSNPSLGGTRPELFPWYLSFIQPALYRDAILQMKSKEVPAAASEMQMDKMEQAQTIANSITVLENQLNTEFEITIPYSIPGDGQLYAVDVQNNSLNALYNYSSVPKLDGDAFLFAHITGWQELNLLPGNANVYFEGSYVGESYFNPKSTDDTLHFSLGRDKRITIKREKLKEFSSNQVLGGNRTRTVSFEISVKNTRKEAVQIEVEDQLPVSQDKEIEVKAIELSGADLNAETGKLAWKLSLASGETVKKRLTFSVKYPKDKIVSGL